MAGGIFHLLANHVVQDRAIFPGAGHLELARAAATMELHGVVFLQPLAVEAASRLLVECRLGEGRFEVRSRADSAVDNATVHCSGALGSGGGGLHAQGWVSSARSCALAADVGALYDGFAAVGLQYGPDYRTLVQAWGGVGSGFAC